MGIGIIILIIFLIINFILDKQGSSLKKRFDNLEKIINDLK